ncbi:MAG: thiazole synthase, partial [Candidatus Dormibacteraceae bacterium]
MQTLAATDHLAIGERSLSSRLFLGTGKYRNDQEMIDALEASESQLVTVALRRLDLDNPAQPTLLDTVDWNRYQILPNTAGCATAEEA